MAYTCLLHSNSWTQFSVEVTSDDLHAFVCSDDTTDHAICLFDLMIWVATVWHVRADQGLRLLTGCCNDTLADAFYPFHSVSPSVVHDDRHTVFVFKLSYFFVWPPCL